MASNTDHLRDDLAEQIAAMRKEVARLSASASKHGGRFFDTASDEASELYAQGQRAARMLSAQARERPGTTVLVAAGAIALLGMLLASSRR